MVWYLMISYDSIAWYCMLLRCWLRRAGCVSEDAYILHLYSITTRWQINQKDSICVNLVSVTSSDVFFPLCSQHWHWKCACLGNQPCVHNMCSQHWRWKCVWATNPPCLLYRYFYHRVTRMYDVQRTRFMIYAKFILNKQEQSYDTQELKNIARGTTDP